MSLFKKEKNVKIIDTGTNLPEVTIEQELRFISEKDRFISNNIKTQSHRTGNIIYGCQSVNAQVKPEFRRQTTDYDIYSKKPKHDAIELEQKIDRHVNANIAQVRQVSYEREGKKGKMYRVELKNFDNLADYNKMPKEKIKTVKIGGVKYMALGESEKKYMKIIDDNYVERLPNATNDLQRIQLDRFWRKVF